MSTSPGCLFVGDLSVCCRESHLKELFEQYGQVLKTEIKQGQKAFKLLGYGFVTLPTAEEAENAMNNLNGRLVLGRRLRINWANNTNNQHEMVCAEVAFSFISKQLDHMVYEQTLRDLFSNYDCEVTDVTIKQYKVEHDTSKHSGTGFVHFPLTHAGVLASKRAVDHLANVCIKDVMYDCELSKKLQMILMHNPQLDVPFTPTRAAKKDTYNNNTTSLKRKMASVQLDIGYELPYVPLFFFEHMLAHDMDLPSVNKQNQNIMTSAQMYAIQNGTQDSGYEEEYYQSAQQMPLYGGMAAMSRHAPASPANISAPKTVQYGQQLSTAQKVQGHFAPEMYADPADVFYSSASSQNNTQKQLSQQASTQQRNGYYPAQQQQLQQPRGVAPGSGVSNSMYLQTQAQSQAMQLKQQQQQKFAEPAPRSSQMPQMQARRGVPLLSTADQELILLQQQRIERGIVELTRDQLLRHQQLLDQCTLPSDAVLSQSQQYYMCQEDEQEEAAMYKYVLDNNLHSLLSGPAPPSPSQATMRQQQQHQQYQQQNSSNIAQKTNLGIAGGIPPYGPMAHQPSPRQTQQLQQQQHMLSLQQQFPQQYRNLPTPPAQGNAGSRGGMNKPVGDQPAPKFLYGNGSTAHYFAQTPLYHSPTSEVTRKSTVISQHSQQAQLFQTQRNSNIQMQQQGNQGQLGQVNRQQMPPTTQQQQQQQQQGNQGQLGQVNRQQMPPTTQQQQHAQFGVNHKVTSNPEYFFPPEKETVGDRKAHYQQQQRGSAHQMPFTLQHELNGLFTPYSPSSAASGTTSGTNSNGGSVQHFHQQQRRVVELDLESLILPSQSEDNTEALDGLLSSLALGGGHGGSGGLASPAGTCSTSDSSSAGSFRGLDSWDRGLVKNLKHHEQPQEPLGGFNSALFGGFNYNYTHENDSSLLDSLLN